MTVSILSPLSFTSYFSPFTPAALQANLYFYFAGTLDPISVYTTADLSIPYAQPVMTTGSGRVPPVWIGELPEGYRVRVFDQFSTLLEDIDYLPGAGSVSVDPGPDADDPTRLLDTGDVVFSYSNNLPRAGFVFANGTSVGSAVSAATGRANDDTQKLFKHLWQQDPFGLLAVFPSRGTSADGDWAANKAIATPNIMGKAPVGVDAMGGAVGAGALTGITFTTGDATKVGSTFGTATRVLLELELPPHTHIVTDPGHVHTGTAASHGHSATAWTDAQGYHQHTVQTYEAGNHTHPYTAAGAVTGTWGSNPGFAAPSGTETGAAGTHSHTGYTDATGSHAHNVGVSVAASGALALAVNTAATGISVSGGGSSQPLPITQPSILLCAYLRL